jgi:predicted outer membrane repeat protein
VHGLIISAEDTPTIFCGNEAETSGGAIYIIGTAKLSVKIGKKVQFINSDSGSGKNIFVQNYDASLLIPYRLEEDIYLGLDLSLDLSTSLEDSNAFVGVKDGKDVDLRKYLCPLQTPGFFFYFFIFILYF